MEEFLRFVAISYITMFALFVSTMLCERTKNIIEEFDDEDL